MLKLVTRRAANIGFLLFPLLYWVAPSSVFSLDPSRSISQFHHTKWTVQDGAPTQVVALAQTTDGFLWIGTSRGLFRFDGVRFERYRPPAGTEAPSENIYSLKASPDGGLWVSFRPSGLGFIKDGSFDVFTGGPLLPASQIYCLELDGKGRLWAGTHEGLALRRDDGTWSEVGEDWGLSRSRVRSLFTDRQGRMWVADDQTVMVLPNDVDRFRQTGEKPAVITGFAEAPDGRVWKGEGLRFVAPIAIGSTFKPAAGVKVTMYVGDLHFDRDGTLWFTDEDGIKRITDPLTLQSDITKLDDPRLDVFDVKDNLSGPILEDLEGNIWIGSPRGLHRFRYSHFIADKASERYRNITLAADPKSGIWVGSSLQLPLIHIDGRNVTSLPEAAHISSFTRDSRGVAWWGGHSRVFRHIGREITPFVQPGIFQDDWLWEVLPASGDEHLWIRPGDVPLVSFENGVWGQRPPPPGLPDRGPSASFSENGERTWLGYTENRVAVVENGIGHTYTSDDGIDVGRIRVIRKAHGMIWIGGELGLALFHGGRFTTIRPAEADRFGTVSGIVPAADGSLWLNEVQGIVRISKDEIDRVAADPEYPLSFRRFDFEDGLPGSPQMNWTVSTAVETADGRLWFATDGGLTWTDPRNLLSNPRPPPVSIRSLFVGEQAYDVYKPIRLPQGTENLSIVYTALSLSIPERVRFRYMLEGVDADWRDAQTRREAFYTNLGPGDYRFRVIAANNDGVWNTEGAVLNFTILPQFYQTGWFVGLCLIVAAILTFLILRWRVEGLKDRMRLQFEERLAERARIAQDLHDTLLQGFVGASMQMDVAVDSLAESSPERGRFKRIHDMIKRQINEGRETVKGLRATPGKDREDLEDLFRQTREELDHEHLIDFRIVVSGQPRVLHPIIHDEVRRIAQEAIFNAFRHAKPSRIDVFMDYSARRFQLSVRDDGKGIDPDIVKTGRKGHWGLTGMRERAEKIGGHLRIWTTPGGGTEIQLSVPATVAYIDSGNGLLRRLFSRSDGSK